MPALEPLAAPASPAVEAARRTRRWQESLAGAYAGSPWWVRWHVRARAAVCPYDALLAQVPEQGDVLDVGCGHGLLGWALAGTGSGARRYTGLDHDPRKLRWARRLPIEATWVLGDLAACGRERFDCVVMADVLYAVPRREWAATLAACRRVLRPGGRLLLQEVVDRPRWKTAVTWLEEVVAVRVLRWTKGAGPRFASVAGYRDALASAGFTVARVEPLMARGLHPHALYVAQRGA